MAHEQKYYYSDVSQNSSSDEYEKDNLPTMYKLYSSRYAVYDYDSLNRLTQRKFTLNTPLYYNYVYKKSDNRNTEGSEKYQTTQIKEEYIGNDVYIYGYDVLGNITSIKTATRSGAATATTHTTAQNYVTYSYDDLGQLKRENLAGKKTSVWDYDNLGNITAKNEYAYTTGTVGTATQTVSYYYKEDDIPYEEEPETTKTYSSWNNLLLAVDLDGSKKITDDETIEYDEIGNPTQYLGAELKWNGRQLTSYKTSDKEISYTYDSNGLRASKTEKDYTTTDGVKTLTKTTVSKYYYVNGQLHFQDTLATKADGSTVATKLYFFYDSNGYLTGVKYNGTNYYAATNRRGDVVAIYNKDLVCLAKYEYDAWGNVISIKDANDVEITSQNSIGVINPIRYRGYYYDAETELYYLQSRYYNAEVGRFLNADGYLTTDADNPIAYNMFAYCGNNPVMYSDPSGCFWEAFITAFSQCLRQAAPVLAGAGAASQLDSPLLGPADIFAATVAIGTVLVCATVATYRTIKTPAISLPKVEEKEKEATIATPSSSTTIYRYGGTNPGNLTPKEKDRFTGLSFSTKPAPGAAKTTIEELNATGVVWADRDGPTHVSVRPVNGTMDDWIEQGSDSVWTQAVKSTVVKWDGY